MRGSRASRGGRAPPGEGPRLKALLDAVLAAPDDDQARLVYADWLVEQGDARGELIQLQVRSIDEPRQRVLLELHAEEWTAPLSPFLDGIPAFARWHLFVRGFVEQLYVNGPSAVKLLLDRQERIFGATPLVKLGFIGFAPGSLSALVGSTYLSRLRELVVVGDAEPGELDALRSVVGDRLRPRR